MSKKPNPPKINDILTWGEQRQLALVLIDTSDLKGETLEKIILDCHMTGRRLEGDVDVYLRRIRNQMCGSVQPVLDMIARVEACCELWWKIAILGGQPEYGFGTLEECRQYCDLISSVSRQYHFQHEPHYDETQRFGGFSLHGAIRELHREMAEIERDAYLDGQSENNQREGY